MSNTDILSATRTDSSRGESVGRAGILPAQVLNTGQDALWTEQAGSLCYMI
jgi:hypothetical protein